MIPVLGEKLLVDLVAWDRMASEVGAELEDSIRIDLAHNA